MILIIKKIKNKIAYQMWVAANLKIKYIWNLNSLEFTWVSELTQNKSHTHTTKTHTKQLNKSHTLIIKKKKKTRTTHTTKTEGTRRIGSVKTEEKEEEEEEKRSGWIKQEEG